MSDNKTIGPPFDADDAAQQKLWRELASLPQEKPSPELRRNFYRKLDQFSKPSALERVSQWLGLQGNPGMATAGACLVIGLAMGLLINSLTSIERGEFAHLQQQVATLNRNLILDRLQDVSASTRLLGVMDAAEMAQKDTSIVNALLARALEDPVHSVRSAAIEALGPQLSNASVSMELMMLLATADSPLVQLALADMVLRYGDSEQIEYLVQISDQGVLPAELADYVHTSIRSNNNESI